MVTLRKSHTLLVQRGFSLLALILLLLQLNPTSWLKSSFGGIDADCIGGIDGLTAATLLLTHSLTHYSTHSLQHYLLLNQHQSLKQHPHAPLILLASSAGGTVDQNIGFRMSRIASMILRRAVRPNAPSLNLDLRRIHRNDSIFAWRFMNSISEISKEHMLCYSYNQY